MKIKVTSDSSCDLSPALIERYKIGICPLTVVLGDKVLHDDGKEISPQDIFNYVSETNTLPKTSATAQEEYANFFNSQLKDCDALIHFNISSYASSSHANAEKASLAFQGKVFVVDSLALSTGQGLLILKACDLLKEGKSPEEVVKEVEALRAKVNTSFIPDSLEYLHKGGRCSLASMIGAKVLKLHPLIVMRDGKLGAKKKYMGSLECCLKRYVEELARDYPEYDDTRCFITHSCCEPEVVNKIRKQVEDTFYFKEILETTAGGVVTSHCGKNTLGVLFIAR